MATSMFNLRSQMNLDSKGRKSAYYKQSKKQTRNFWRRKSTGGSGG